MDPLGVVGAARAAHSALARPVGFPWQPPIRPWDEPRLSVSATLRLQTPSSHVPLSPGTGRRRLLALLWPCAGRSGTVSFASRLNGRARQVTGLVAGSDAA